MSATLPGLPKPGTSWCLPGAAIPTQAAIPAGQYSYPLDAFGAYRTAVDPDLSVGHSAGKKVHQQYMLLF